MQSMANSLPIKGQWQTLVAGFNYQEFSVDSISPFAKLHVIDIELNKIKLRFCNVNNLATAKASMDKNNAIMAFNGGFFSTDNAPIGLRVAHGKIISPYKPISWWHTFAIRGNAARIYHRKTSQDEIRQLSFATQSGPRLIKNRKVISLKEGVAARTALCIKENGHVNIVISQYAELSTGYLANFMRKKLDCIDALNLDGGSSTQLSINLPGLNKNILGLARVPDPICLYQR